MKVYLRILYLMIGDYVSFFGIFMFTAYCCLSFMDNYEIGIYLRLWPAGIVLIFINEIARLYHGTLFYPGVSLGPAEELRRIFYSVTSVFFALFIFLFLAKNTAEYSKAVLVISWPLCILGAVITRWILRVLFKKHNYGNIHAIILGAGKTGTKVAKVLNKNKYLGIAPVIFLDDNDSLHGKKLENIPVKGSIDRIKDLSKKYGAEYVIICLPMKMIQSVIREYGNSFKHILIIPDEKIFSALWVYAYDINGILGLEVRSNLLLKPLLYLKTFLDYFFTLVLSFLCMPVMLLCAILIKLTSKGPVIYKAHRLGVGGKVFGVYKFRTMKINSEKHFEEYLEDNPDAKKEWESSYKLRKDPRITWVGRFLRVTSLDELPQLWNVLRGEMSLIGPRPIVEQEKKYYADKYELIASVRPGITGLWQVSGRSDLDYHERVELDCYYLMNWNIWLDIFILLKTIKEVLFCKGAF